MNLPAVMKLLSGQAEVKPQSPSFLLPTLKEQRTEGKSMPMKYLLSARRAFTLGQSAGQLPV